MKRSLLLLAMLFTCFGLNLLQADDAAPQPSPDEELRSLQGDWKVTWSIGGATTLFGETPRVIQSLQRKDLEVKIEEGRLSFGCTRVIRGETLTLCNELPAGMVKDKSPLNGGGRYVLLTTEEGKGLLASYALNGDSVTFRYPAGCCSRSGNVITLTKVK
jgi:hypothetical protein